ncbi:MAG: hypothetical protein ACYTXY_30870 [Nostoc sp.]
MLIKYKFKLNMRCPSAQAQGKTCGGRSDRHHFYPSDCNTGA